MNSSVSANCVEPSTLYWRAVAALDGVHVGTPEAAAEVLEGSECVVVGGSATPLTKTGLEGNCMCGVNAGGYLALSRNLACQLVLLPVPGCFDSACVAMSYISSTCS